jgi:hypothetical protein
MRRIFFFVTAFIITLSQGCSKNEPIFGDRQQFFGTWSYDLSIVSIREDGEIIWDYTEENNRLIFLENGTLIQDRIFFRDTSQWFFVSEPPTLIFGDFLTGSQFGSPGLLAKTLEVRDFSEDSFIMIGEGTLQDSLGREIEILETWTVAN